MSAESFDRPESGPFGITGAGPDLYDRIGRNYTGTRHPDPRIAAAIRDALEYLPEFLDLIPPRYRRREAWEVELRSVFASLELVPVPIPHDCTDGFYGAYWRRPEAFLDPAVRAGISVFAQLTSGAVDRAIAVLGADLQTGRWANKHRSLLTVRELHLGYYVIVAEPTSHTGGRT